jgi:hypothetical protein
MCSHSISQSIAASIGIDSHFGSGLTNSFYGLRRRPKRVLIGCKLDDIFQPILPLDFLNRLPRNIGPKFQDSFSTYFYGHVLFHLI